MRIRIGPIRFQSVQFSWHRTEVTRNTKPRFRSLPISCTEIAIYLYKLMFFEVIQKFRRIRFHCKGVVEEEVPSG